MKRMTYMIAILATFFVVSSAEARFTTGIELSLSFSSINTYGEWIDCSYGRVWRPVHVQHGWRPYMYGRWVWTDYGWYWMSDEPFGWATFHYGRWSYDSYYGWVWIPDDTWGPAWVEWRYSDDYIGWAPLPPSAHFSVSVGISFATAWNAPVHYWNFVPCRSFTSVRVVDYVQPVERTHRFFGNTRSVRTIESRGDRVINRGVDVGFVERRTRTRIERTTVVNRTTGDGDRIVRAEGRQHLEVYRPRIDRSTRTGADIRQENSVGVESRRGQSRRNEVTGAERRTEQRQEFNRTESPRSESGTRKRYEVQRNSQIRREAWEQKQQSRDNRQTTIERSQTRERREALRREPQIQRKSEPPKTERRFDTGGRQFRTNEQPRTPEQKNERKPPETRTRGRKP